MSSATFDTHKFVQRLRQAGVPEAQAEVMAEALKESQENAELVTKKDLHIAIADLRTDLKKWGIGLALAQIGLLVSILMRLPH